jgi:hypothetical protein
MSPSGKRVVVPSLEALRRKVNLETLAHLQPLLLLQMVVGVSQTVNSHISHSPALARTLLLSGQQRMRDLLDAAPRLHLPLEQVLEFCRAGDVDRTPEETAAQALFELCLGLMLHWLAEIACRQPATFALRSRKRARPSYSLSYPSQSPPRARSCLSAPLA